MKFKISAGSWCLGSYGERYVPSGYHEELSLEKQLDIFSKVEGLDGLGFEYPLEKSLNDSDNLIKILADYGLKVADLSVEDYSDRKWKHGALATNEKVVREENLRLCKEAIDFASNLPDSKVMIWPAHDGFDYPFQVSYEEGWKNMVESYRKICSYNEDVTIAVEYKSKDPR